MKGRGGLKPRSLGQIHPKSIPPALIAARHLSRSMAKLLLNIALINLGGGGEASAERVPGKLEGALDCSFSCEFDPFFRFAVIHLRRIKLLSDNSLHRVWWANAKWKNGLNPAETQHTRRTEVVILSSVAGRTICRFRTI
jgi:hypothetical protein